MAGEKRITAVVWALQHIHGQFWIIPAQMDRTKSLSYFLLVTFLYLCLQMFLCQRLERRTEMVEFGFLSRMLGVLTRGLVVLVKDYGTGLDLSGMSDSASDVTRRVSLDGKQTDRMQRA